MTREEAIERMKIIKGDCYIIDNLKDKEAFDMSISALEQEPYELLIIKSDIFLHQEDRKKWIEGIKREKENGVIILPPYFTPLLVPNDVEIRIEQPCDDAISREAVIKLFNGNIGSEAALILHMVKQLPSATQKSGHWIEHEHLYKCSVCGEISCCHGRFCNECGAKMESEDKE